MLDIKEPSAKECEPTAPVNDPDLALGCGLCKDLSAGLTGSLGNGKGAPGPTADTEATNSMVTGTSNL